MEAAERAGEELGGMSVDTTHRRQPPRRATSTITSLEKVLARLEPTPAFVPSPHVVAGSQWSVCARECIEATS
jgi:hypothetical protein